MFYVLTERETSSICVNASEIYLILARYKSFKRAFWVHLRGPLTIDHRE